MHYEKQAGSLLCCVRSKAALFMLLCSRDVIAYGPWCAYGAACRRVVVVASNKRNTFEFFRRGYYILYLSLSSGIS